MTITYRGNGAWGVGKGSNLTAAEIDGNFYDHEGRIDALETTPPAPVEISSITQAGDTITVHMSDGSTHGPFNLPYAPQRPTVTTAVSGATLTPTSSQSSYYFRCTNGAGCVVTVEDEATGGFLADTEYHFRQVGAGPITFVSGGTDVVINVPDGFVAMSSYLGATMTLKKVGTDEWDLFGALETTT